MFPPCHCTFFYWNIRSEQPWQKGFVLPGTKAFLEQAGTCWNKQEQLNLCEVLLTQKITRNNCDSLLPENLNLIFCMSLCIDRMLSCSPNCFLAAFSEVCLNRFDFVQCAGSLRSLNDLGIRRSKQYGIIFPSVKRRNVWSVYCQFFTFAISTIPSNEHKQLVFVIQAFIYQTWLLHLLLGSIRIIYYTLRENTKTQTHKKKQENASISGKPTHRFCMLSQDYKSWQECQYRYRENTDTWQISASVSVLQVFISNIIRIHF